MSQINPDKQAVYDYCRTMLGDGMIDIELDPKHYETALDRALAVFRQRSDNSVEESMAFLITTISSILALTVGCNNKPAYTNTYLLSSTNMGGLATYELFAGYQEMVGKMFGSYINFNWVPQSRKIVLQQRPRAEEELMLWVYNTRPDSAIINDTYAGQWIKDYSLANCKMMLGQAREKFAQLAGPQGGSSLNGAAMKSEAAAEIEKLTTDLTMLVPGGHGYSFIIG